MSDLVEQARVYATRAHERIDQRRKYNKAPYDVHLEAVATLVSQVSDDAEMIAAAWLHDTVEDTPATLDDIEREFGVAVAELVEELTDVSRPGDGNRAARKAIDRRHTAQASARAKTVKLADLMDNCKDITRHDPRFAKIYLNEMQLSLEVLKEGDERLYREALLIHRQSMEKLGLQPQPSESLGEMPVYQARIPGMATPQFRRMFADMFTAVDIADTLLSFDAGMNCRDAHRALKRKGWDIATVRGKGAVRGYVRLEELAGERDCTECMRHFTPDQIVEANAPISDVIHVLTRHDFCFVSLLGDVVGVIDRDDVNKPMVRMWLFGMITMIEMGVTELVARYFPNDSWVDEVSEGRLAKARQIQSERQRRRQHCALVECLQLSDKGQILLTNPVTLDLLGFASKRVGKKVVKDMESLRNNLAHAQDIVTHDWAQIARMTQRIHEAIRNS